MNEANPYTAPTTAPPTEAPVEVDAVRRVDPEAIREAIRRLNEHLASPHLVEEDSRSTGRRFRVPTILFLLIALAGLGVVAAGNAGGNQAMTIAGAAGSFIGAIVFLVMLVQDLSVPPRARAADPAQALKGWIAALRTGRGGYVRSCLCPTARAVEARVPDLKPVVTADGSYPMDEAKPIREWCRSFACAGKGQVRWTKVKAVSVVRQEGDVAEVAAEVRMQSWPQWANIVSIVLFLVIRLLGIIVALVLFYTQRKKRTVTVHKTLIRGRDGLWYVLDPAFPSP